MPAHRLEVTGADLDESYIGVYVEIEHHGGRIAGVVSDVLPVTTLGVHAAEFYPTHRAFVGPICPWVHPHTHVQLGGQHALIDLASDTVYVAAPLDPCDGTPMPDEPATAATPLDEVTLPAPRRTRGRGLWLTVLLASALYGFGLSMALSAPALSGATLAGLTLMAGAGAIGMRLVQLATRTRQEPTP